MLTVQILSEMDELTWHIQTVHCCPTGLQLEPLGCHRSASWHAGRNRQINLITCPFSLTTVKHVTFVGGKIFVFSIMDFLREEMFADF